MDERCETCRFAKLYPMPEGECPPLPDFEEPEGLLAKLIGIPHFQFADLYFKSLPHFRWKEAKRKAETEMECQRFPDAKSKLKTDWCGEYRESRPGTGVKVEIDQARDDVVDLWNRMSERGN